MKKNLRIFMSILCLCLFLTSLLTPMVTAMAKGDGTTYINKDDITEHNIKVISNVAGDTSMVLYEYQSHFYITMDTVEELTGLSTFVSIGNGLYYATVTDGIRTVYVNLEDRTISDEINDKTVKDSSGHEILNDINAMLYSDKFLVEAVPFLRYLGAEVKYEDGIFYSTIIGNSIWSVLPPDGIKDVDKFLFPLASYIPDYKKRFTMDIIGDYIAGGNLIISREKSMNNYYKEAIYDVFKVNPYSYSSVEEQKKLDTERLLNLGDQLKDVSIESAKILEDLKLTKEIDWLNFKWNGAYKLGFTHEANKISQELNTKVVKWHDDTFEGGNIDKVGNVVSAIVYVTKIYNAYSEINNYDNDTAYCLSAEVESMRYAYTDTSSIGWLPTADRVSKEVINNRNNAVDSILDNTIDLLQDEGNDLIISSASSELILPVNFATFMTNLICNDTIEAEHREIITMLQQDMQYQSYNLCCELWRKADSENFSNLETVIRFADALKFFYRFSMAYNNSIQQWGEHYYPNDDWNRGAQKRNDMLALKFYNLLNASMIPNKNLFNYKAMTDDVFSLDNLESTVPINNSNNEESIKDVLFNETSKEPIKYYYDSFEKDGTFGIIAIYQYEGDYSENDNCQVWYSNGELTKKLFEFENTYGTMAYCNVLDNFIYNDTSGRPYVVLTTWQRVAMSSNSVKIFGLSDIGSIDMVFEVSGDITVEGDKMLVHEYYPQSPGVTVPESSYYEISIVDGAVIKKDSGDLRNEYVKENTEYHATRSENGFVENFTMKYNKETNSFYVDGNDEMGRIFGFDLPITSYENGIYYYSNGTSYFRNASTGGRIPATSGLSGTIQLDDDNNIIWTNNEIEGSIDRFTINLSEK